MSELPLLLSKIDQCRASIRDKALGEFELPPGNWTKGEVDLMQQGFVMGYEAGFCDGANDAFESVLKEMQ